MDMTEGALDRGSTFSSHSFDSPEVREQAEDQTSLRGDGSGGFPATPAEPDDGRLSWAPCDDLEARSRALRASATGSCHRNRPRVGLAQCTRRCADTEMAGSAYCPFSLALARVPMVRLSVDQEGDIVLRDRFWRGVAGSTICYSRCSGQESIRQWAGHQPASPKPEHSELGGRS